MSDPMTPAVLGPTVEALSEALDAHAEFASHGGLHSDDWACICGYVFTAPGSLRQGASAHRAHLATVLAARLAARAAAPDALRVAVEALAAEWERFTGRARPAFLVAADELRALLDDPALAGRAGEDPS